MKELSPPSTKTPLMDPGETTLNHNWQRWFSDLYNYLTKSQTTIVVNNTNNEAGLAAHIAKTGTQVHGLGTASTHDVGDFDPAGAAAKVAADLQDFEDYAIFELNNRVILYDPIPPEDTMLVKSADTSKKTYERLDVGDGLQISMDPTGRKFLESEYSDLLERLSRWVQLYPLPEVGRRLISPLGSPFTQGKIYQ